MNIMRNVLTGFMGMTVVINFSGVIIAIVGGPGLRGIIPPSLLLFVSIALLFYVWRPRSAADPRLSHPPGWSLRSFAELCFSKKTFTQVLEPTLGDMQKEHFEALAAGRRWQARMVLVRGYWAFWSAVAAQLPISFARRVFEVWKATKTGS